MREILKQLDELAGKAADAQWQLRSEIIEASERGDLNNLTDKERLQLHIAASWCDDQELEEYMEAKGL